MNSNGKISIWSVVVLITSVIIMAVGFSLGLINSKATNDIDAFKVDIQTIEKRVQILERQTDVTNNELEHINKKLDFLIKEKNK